MRLAKLSSELSRAFTARDLKFGGAVRSQVGYCLFGGRVSVYISSSVIKMVPVGLLSGWMMDGSRGTVPTLGGGSGVLCGTTLVGAAGRVILGMDFWCRSWLWWHDGLPKLTVSCDRASSLLLEVLQRSPVVGYFVGL